MLTATGPIQARQRQPGGGRNPELTTAEDKLFFILFYVKCYPTFDVAGVLFEVHRSQAHRWVHTLRPLLEQTLETVLKPPGPAVSSNLSEVLRLPNHRNIRPCSFAITLII